LNGLDALQIKYWPAKGIFVLKDPPINDMEFTSFLEQRGIMVRVSVGSLNGRDCFSVTKLGQKLFEIS